MATKNNKTRKLADLVSVGKATLSDFKLLGVSTVSALAKQDPFELYQRLSRITNSHQDICVLDVFTAAVAQAKNPNLAPEERNWWYWSRVRKGLATNAKK